MEQGNQLAGAVALQDGEYGFEPYQVLLQLYFRYLALVLHSLLLSAIIGAFVNRCFCQ